MRLRSLVLALVAAAAATAPAPAAEARSERLPAPTATDLATDGATLVATLPRGGEERVHLSWRSAGAPWRPTARRRARSRTVSVRLAGLRAATTYRVRFVADRRAGRSALFTTLPPPAPSRTPPGSDPSPLPVAQAGDLPPPAADPGSDPLPEPEPEPPPPGNPVFAGEFADPSILRAGDRYWAFGTGYRFPILRSDDLVEWRSAGRALPARPAWATTAAEWHPWAPSVTTAGDGYVLFYVALADVLGPMTNCVGVATSAAPGGPYTDLGPLADADGAPIGCGDERGHGNIDPAPFVDAAGDAYLYVSTDWACDEEGAPCTLAPELSVIPLAPDLLSAAGPRVPLFRGLPATWEQAPWAAVVENPWVVERDGTYHLLYSGGAWTRAYGMGHATASSPLGPFTRTTRILKPANAVTSAGGGMLIEGPAGGDWLAYHGRSGSFGAPRTLRIDPVTWPEDGGPPLIDGPSSAPFRRLP